MYFEIDENFDPARPVLDQQLACTKMSRDLLRSNDFTKIIALVDKRDFKVKCELVKMYFEDDYDYYESICDEKNFLKVAFAQSLRKEKLTDLTVDKLVDDLWNMENPQRDICLKIKDNEAAIISELVKFGREDKHARSRLIQAAFDLATPQLVNNSTKINVELDLKNGTFRLMSSDGSQSGSFASNESLSSAAGSGVSSSSARAQASGDTAPTILNRHHAYSMIEMPRTQSPNLISAQKSSISNESVMMEESRIESISSHMARKTVILLYDHTDYETNLQKRHKIGWFKEKLDKFDIYFKEFCTLIEGSHASNSCIELEFRKCVAVFILYDDNLSVLADKTRNLNPNCKFLFIMKLIYLEFLDNHLVNKRFHLYLLNNVINFNDSWLENIYKVDSNGLLKLHKNHIKISDKDCDRKEVEAALVRFCATN